MKLIEDLGLHEYGTHGYKTRYGIYECPVCGKHFRCSISAVKSGNTTRCRECANTFINTGRSTLAALEFVEKALAIHGDLYNYTHFTYSSNKTKGSIGCNACGTTFWQTPAKHLSGQGCPHCAKECNSIAKRVHSVYPTTLYYVYFPEYNLYKIGCTRRTLQKRFRKIKVELLESVNFSSGGDAYRLEQLILASVKTIRYHGVNIMVGGNTEILTQPINFTEVLGDAYVKYLQEYL